MERVAKLHIEKLPEGVYLATSDDIPGLVAQGRTIAETLEIARDVARKLLEARTEREGEISLAFAEESFDYPLIFGARWAGVQASNTGKSSSVCGGLASSLTATRPPPAGNEKQWPFVGYTPRGKRSTPTNTMNPYSARSVACETKKRR